MADFSLANIYTFNFSLFDCCLFQEKYMYGRVEWAKNERKYGRPMLEGTRTYHSRLFQNFGKPRKDKRVKYTDKDW